MNQKDTSKVAGQVLTGIYRQMPTTVKAARVFGAYRMGQLLGMAGLRLSHPNASEKQIWYLWAKQHLGEKLFSDVYGDLPDE